MMSVYYGILYLFTALFFDMIYLPQMVLRVILFFASTATVMSYRVRTGEDISIAVQSFTTLIFCSIMEVAAYKNHKTKAELFLRAHISAQQ